MDISVFDIFRIGLGPSSSHTVGPMRAALRFAETLEQNGWLTSTKRVELHLYGSLALTGTSHGIERGLLNGLEGWTPQGIDPDLADHHVQRIQSHRSLLLLGRHPLEFDPNVHIVFHPRESLPKHANGMHFFAYDKNHLLFQEIYYSIGGGFIVADHEFGHETLRSGAPYPFDNAETLLRLCREQGFTIAQLMFENEKTWAAPEDIHSNALGIYEAMRACIERGCSQEGLLPGPFKVRRRAAALYRKLLEEPSGVGFVRQHDALHWLNAFAMAVNEENAMGGRVVTAPTNGASGVIPSVLHYTARFHPQCTDQWIVDFLLTAGAIGILYKKGASISGAEVGCQGEVGSASSMAAGALAAVLGGTLEQVENAAEIAMEHHLGMTCDPVGGLVQIPCIERNAMGAVKAVNAAIWL